MTPESAVPQPEQVAAFFRKHRTGLVALVFTDLVDSTALLNQLGDQAGASFLRKRREIIRDTLRVLPEAEEIETAGDSFLLVFSKPSDAVRFALLTQARLRVFSAESRLSVQERIGIHLGEVVISEHETEVKAKDLYGLQLATCARVMSLAKGAQILLTRGVFDSARQVLKGEDLAGVGPLSWVSHGPYVLKGIEEAVEVCEVGEAGQSPLAAPKTSEKAQRQVRADEEPVLGWRPAVGQEVPNTKWVLEAKLGEGGFGEVWVGRHQAMKERRVFKFCFRADRVRSLKREMTLFRLIKERIGDHPNIVSLREVYFDEPPFYVEMDYVEGQELKSWCETQGGVEKVPLEVRLEIIAQVADALQSAHDAGVIHRDVKPGNILVSGQWSVVSGRKTEDRGQRTEDGGPRVAASEQNAGARPPTSDLRPPAVKLTDFGIGQVVSEEYLKGVTRAGFTQTMLGSSTSSQTGTQLYMAPELWAGKPASTRSDIYSLGVVLYQLLVGDFTRPVTTDWAKRIEDPLLREDLALCFAGEPQDRFAGAGQLARNLRALPQRQALLAAQQAEQAAREKAAYRRGVIRTAALAVLLVTVFAGLAIYALRTAREEARQRDLARGSQYSAEMNLAQQAYAEGRVARALSLLERHVPGSAGQKDLRGFEWRYLWRLCKKGDALHTFRVHTNAVTAVAFSATDRLVTSSSEGAVKVLNVATRREMASFQAKDKASTVAVSANGEVVAAGFGNGIVKLWPLGAKQDQITIPESGEVSKLALSPDGKTLAIACTNGVRLWDVAEQREAPALPWTNGILFTDGMTFSPDGKLLASAGGQRVTLWSVAERRELEPMLNLHSSAVLGVAFSPDGRTLATGSWDTTIKFWDLASRGLLATLLGHRAGVGPLAFSPDGQTLASGGGDDVVKLWDIGTRTNAVLKATLKGHVANVCSLAFSPDGKMLASGSGDGAVNLWPTEPHASADLLQGHTDWAFSVAFSPDDRVLASAGFDGTIRLWDLKTGAEKSVIPVSPYDIFTVAFSPDGTTLATAEGRWRGARLANVSTPALVRLRPVANPSQVLGLGDGDWKDVRAAVFSPDGKKLASCRFVGVKFWSLPEGREIARLPAPAHTLQFSPDGRYFATASWGGKAKLWNAATLNEIPLADDDRNFGGGPNVTFSPDSRILATGASRLKLWNVANQQLLAILEGHKGAIMCVRFSPDGKTLATGSVDHSVKLWSLATRQEVATLEGHTGAVSGLAFSSDGTLLASSSEDKTIRLWRAASWAEIQAVEKTGAKTR